MPDDLDRLLTNIRACRTCLTAPLGRHLPHEPRPVLRVSATARLAVCGQAPGTRVHASGVPFSDPSGARLRRWMGVTAEEFYDVRQIAIVPMGFCFPGLDAKGSDLPPRAECAPQWRARVFGHLPHVQLILLVGSYAQAWHLGLPKSVRMRDVVANWRDHLDAERVPVLLPLPHPSWRNTGWLKANPWFAADLLPRLQAEVRKLIS